MKESTVLILGAGASKPYGLPLGRELRDEVLSIRTTDPNQKLLNQFGITRDHFHEFCADLQMSGFQTVDAFLEKRPTWLKVGKVATAIALDEKEKEERLFPPNQPKDHWYEALWHALRVSSWKALKGTHVKVVTFNYDRTLQCYLTGVIANNCRVQRATAAEWLNEEFILHPHGNLGMYRGERWHMFSGDRPDRYTRVKTALDSIVVISEASTRTVAFREVKRVLGGARRVIFLGFGYHEANMIRLGFPDLCAANERLYVSASRKGIPNQDWELLCKRYFKGQFIEKVSWPSMSKLVTDCVR